MTVVSRLDPTRTTTTRRRFAAATAARFRRVSQRLRETLPPALAPGGRWAHLDRADQVRAFRVRLRGQLAATLLSPAPRAISGGSWPDPFIAAAYRRGVLNAYADARPDPGSGDDTAAYAGGREQFLRDMTTSPAGVARVRQLQERAADGIEDIVSTLFARLGRAFADAVAAGLAVPELVATLVKVVRALIGARAIPLAHNEVAHSHAEAQLDAYERMGFDRLGVVPESLTAAERIRGRGPTGNESRYTGFKAVVDTAGDNRVCELCQAKEGKVYTIAYARGLIPLHTRCRCSWKLVKDPDRRRKRTATATPATAVRVSR